MWPWGTGVRGLTWFEGNSLIFFLEVRFEKEEVEGEGKGEFSVYSQPNLNSPASLCVIPTLHTAAVPAVRVEAKTELSYRNDTR